MKPFALALLFVIAVLTGIFLPYFHGDYDRFAVGISYILQFASFTSLLLVPVGLVWCVKNFMNRNKGIATYPIYIRTITLIIVVLMFLAAALGSLASDNRFFAIIILGTGALVLLNLRKKGKELKPQNSTYSYMPYYFIFIPLTVVFIRLTYFEKVKDQSTNFVIKQSKLLIHDIESYKKTNGHYPISIQSTIEDYHTSVSGIQRFYYEPNGNAYNLYFEQVSNMLGTQEIVMYNKLGEHEMTVHNEDLLRIAPENIIRGYHKVADLPQQHWKIFYFD
jgi:hypothetical protein